jgi:hypothetical protein
VADRGGVHGRRLDPGRADVDGDHQTRVRAYTSCSVRSSDQSVWNTPSRSTRR